MTIEASQAGDATYAPATPVQRSFTANAALLTASITVSNKVYDGTTAATVTNYDLSGKIGSDVVTASGTATFSGKNVGAG